MSLDSAKVRYIHANGTPARAAEIKPGDSVRFSATITEKDVQAFAEVSGDHNPLHMDDAFAKRTSYQRRVVHGMILASYVSRLVGVNLPGPGALWTQQSFRWLSPVFIGDTVEAVLTVKHKSSASNLLSVSAKVTNQNGITVMEGEGTVMALEVREERSEPAPAQRTALVTGGSRGMGAAIALELGRSGFAVAVGYREQVTQAKQVCEQILAAGGRALPVAADVLEAGAIAAALRRIENELGGGVDILVNNTGMPAGSRNFLDLTWQDLQTQLDVQVRGAFHCCQAVIPGMIDRGWGRIVNIGSTLAKGAPPLHLTGFVTAKAALNALTRALAAEFGPKGINVNMVSPGLVETDSISEIPERMRKLAAMQTPTRRLAAPQDVAHAVAFLCSEAGASIVGADIPVCGGAVM